MTTHFSILAWRIPWTEEPGGPWVMTKSQTWLKHLSATHTIQKNKDLLVALHALWVLSSLTRDWTCAPTLEAGHCASREAPTIFLFFCFFFNNLLGFPGGSVVKNPPASAGDTSSFPGLGRPHMPRSSQACAPQLLSLCSRACTAVAEAGGPGSPCSAAREAPAMVCAPQLARSPRSPKLEKALRPLGSSRVAVRGLPLSQSTDSRAQGLKQLPHVGPVVAAPER